MKKTAYLLVAALILGTLQSGTGLAVGSTTDQGPFSDVYSDTETGEAVQYLKDNKIVTGYSDGSFKPTTIINRAEFTKIIMGSMGVKLSGKDCFNDVKDEWFAPYVCTAKARGIINGYADGSFKPADPIKFSEASKIVANAYGLTLEPKDALDSSSWYKQYVNALAAKKAIPLTVHYFDENITRESMANIVWRIKGGIQGRVSRSYNEIAGTGLISGNSCSELQQRFQTSSLLRNGGDVIMDADFGQAAPSNAVPTAAAEKSTSAGGSSSYSTTNVQVSGVDEADVVKNDGKFIYLVKGNSVRIVEAYPAANLKELVTVKLGDENESFTPSEMYVNGDQMVVLGSVYHTTPTVTDSAGSTQTTQNGEISAKMIAPPYYWQGRQSKVYVLDITDRSKPVVKRWVEFDGSYNTSRRIDNTLYVVLTDNVYFPPYYRIMSNGSTSSSTVSSSPEDSVPHVTDSMNNKKELASSCSDIKIMPKTNDHSYLVAAAIPLNDLSKPVKRSVLIGSAQNIYASTKNLYVATTDWTGGFYKPDGYNTTVINKFALSDAGIDFKGTANVSGTVLNQFSMDEKDDNFRIATTTDNYGTNDKSSNSLYVLDKNLSQIGKLENIATGEKIYSVRFMGNRAYMVTFKHVDPLFVIDLSTPTVPKILGKLKIPGYSTYLHPYDENHIMGFGNEVDESIDADKVHSDDAVYYTAVQGMKIGMFDVTDVSHPVEMYKEVIGDRGTYSELLNNHKALLFDKEKNLLAFPVTVYKIAGAESCYQYTYSSCPSSCRQICVPSKCSYDNGVEVCTTDCDGQKSCVNPDETYGKPVFDGAYVYNVDLSGGFKLKGTISHYTTTDTEKLTSNGYTDYLKSIQRILYIGENLYTVSQSMVKANLMSDISEVGKATLAGDSSSGLPFPIMY